MIHAAVILVAALILDVLLGDPPFPFHPVRLIGATISAFEKIMLRLSHCGLFDPPTFHCWAASLPGLCFGSLSGLLLPGIKGLVQAR